MVCRRRLLRVPKSQQRHQFAHLRFFLTLLLAVTVHFASPFVPNQQFPSASAMSTDNSSSKNKDASSLAAGESHSNENNSKNDNEEGEGPLLLPEGSNDPSIPRIKFGETVSFEEMGPVIINADGTTRRIDNWDKMTKKEQEVTWRRISKRNAERRAALLEQQQQQQDGK